MTQPLPWRIERFETLPSTSDHCAERARNAEPDRLLVIAARQTAGRGRAGRSWSSPPGNFYASALLRPDSPATQGGLFALIAGLSLLEALFSFPVIARSEATPQSIPPGPLTLKWPNDIMSGSTETGWAKLAGILLDATIEADRIATLIIGFGVNLAFAPEIPGRATTSAAAIGLSITPDDLAPRLTDRLDHWQQSTPETLRTTWLARAHPIGSPLTIDAGRLTGHFAGIDADGSLLLRQDDHIARIRSGEISLL